MELVATLLTDLPLDEQRFRAVLLASSRTSLSGAIAQRGMTATHSFGDAEEDVDVREVKVICRPANTAPRAALTELRKQGFEPRSSLEFQIEEHPETRQDAWTLVGIYAGELKGWVITTHLDFDEAAARAGSAEGLLHAPVGGRHKGVLIASSTLQLLTS